MSLCLYIVVCMCVCVWVCVCVYVFVFGFIFQWKMYLLYVSYQSATPSWGRGRVMQLNTSPFDAPGPNPLIHHLCYHFFCWYSSSLHISKRWSIIIIIKRLSRPSQHCFLNSCYDGDDGCKTPGRLKARCCCWWQRQTLMSFCGRCLFIGDQIRQIHH